MRAFFILFTIILTSFSPIYTYGNSVVGGSESDNPLNTGLAIVYINTYNSDILKNDYIECEITIQNADGICSDVIHGSIKGRGNTTWYMPKKPYNIKLNNKASILGLPAAKKFALLANWYDRTLCRTAVGMKLGQLVDVEWPLHCEYVEVVLNGMHVGNYLIAESVEIGKNRINIDKEKGVIVEYRYPQQLNEDHKYFYTDYNNWLFEFKDPNGDDLSDHQYQMAKSKMDEFEQRHLKLKAKDKDIEEFVSLESFVKWYYVKNILQMDECNRYYVIEDGNDETKVKMGPLWDFDWTLGIDMHYKHYTYCYPRNKLYFKYLANNTYFLQCVAEYHFANRDRIETELMKYYDGITTLIRNSQQIEESIWHQCEAGNVRWEEEINTDRTFLHKTFLWLDNYLKPYCPNLSNIDGHAVVNQQSETYDLCGRQISDSPSMLSGKNCIYILGGKKFLGRLK